MSFWRENVPKGTRLLSGPVICSMSDDGFDTSAYESWRGTSLPTPFTAEQFIAYGLWFQRSTCPNPDERAVVNVTRARGGYTIRVDDGDEITADQLVIAIGLKTFAFRPAALAAASQEFVSHTSDLHDLSGLAGKRVAIIGRGQSAIDCAALLAEQNADVEVLTRSKHLRWGGTLHSVAGLELSVFGRKRYLRAAIRDAIGHPEAYRRLPAFLRAFLLKNAMRPGASRDLMLRVRNVQFGLGRNVVKAHVNRYQVKLHLGDGSTRIVDHVVLGTGYRIDVDAISFLSPELRREIRQQHGYPELNAGMESTAPGLYFIGAAAAWNFGRSMWLVQGAARAAKIIVRALGVTANHSRH